MAATGIGKVQNKQATGRNAWPKTMLSGSLGFAKSRKDGLTHEQELLGLFVAQQSNLSLAMPALAVLMATAALMWSSVVSVGYWLSTIFICQGIQLILCRNYRLEDPRKVDLVKWGSRLASSELGYALAWCSLLFVFWDPANDVQRAFMVATLIVVTSVRLVVSAHFLPIIFAGTVPITLAIVLKCALAGEPLYLAMAGIAVLVELYFVQLAKRIQQTARDMLAYRSQKDALIAELERSNAISDEARRRAEHNANSKTRFLATVSHELRTPLNAVIGFSEIMKEEMLGKHQVDSYREYSADIHSAGTYLLGLINEILDHTKLEANKYQLHLEPIEIAKIAKECIGLVQLKADEGNLTLKLIAPTRLPRVMADERAVKQICLNLLSNAIKFTPEGGRVTLTISITRLGTLQVSVRDTGIGIAEEEIPEVLTSFGQSSKSFDMAKEGVGLGLPIVDGLVRLHGGRMQIRSQVNAGTEVVIEFPEKSVPKGSPIRSAIAA
ncbi:MAG: HAMP domain-containing histidine kinase [Rhizobiales bacterium]|nr:HAMP domain-containing histidine kinase [Hyphomicrobiales bacterium]